MAGLLGNSGGSALGSFLQSYLMSRQMRGERKRQDDERTRQEAEVKRQETREDKKQDEAIDLKHAYALLETAASKRGPRGKYLAEEANRLFAKWNRPQVDSDDFHWRFEDFAGDLEQAINNPAAKGQDSDAYREKTMAMLKVKYGDRFDPFWTLAKVRGGETGGDAPSPAAAAAAPPDPQQAVPAPADPLAIQGLPGMILPPQASPAPRMPAAAAPVPPGGGMLGGPTFLAQERRPGLGDLIGGATRPPQNVDVDALVRAAGMGMTAPGLESVAALQRGVPFSPDMAQGMELPWVPAYTQSKTTVNNANAGLMRVKADIIPRQLTLRAEELREQRRHAQTTEELDRLRVDEQRVSNEIRARFAAAAEKGVALDGRKLDASERQNAATMAAQYDKMGLDADTYKLSSDISSGYRDTAKSYRKKADYGSGDGAAPVPGDDSRGDLALLTKVRSYPQLVRIDNELVNSKQSKARTRSQRAKFWRDYIEQNGWPE